jgi:hypothetical protein
LPPQWRNLLSILQLQSQSQLQLQLQFQLQLQLHLPLQLPVLSPHPNPSFRPKAAQFAAGVEKSAVANATPELT